MENTNTGLRYGLFLIVIITYIILAVFTDGIIKWLWVMFALIGIIVFFIQNKDEDIEPINAAIFSSLSIVLGFLLVPYMILDFLFKRKEVE